MHFFKGDSWDFCCQVSEALRLGLVFPVANVNHTYQVGILRREVCPLCLGTFFLDQTLNRNSSEWVPVDIFEGKQAGVA